MKPVITCSDGTKVCPRFTLHKDKHGVCVTWSKQQHQGSKAFLWQSAKHGSTTCEANKGHQSIFLSSSLREKIVLKSQAQINWVSNWTREPHDPGPPWWPLIKYYYYPGGHTSSKMQTLWPSDCLISGHDSILVYRFILCCWSLKKNKNQR